MSKTKVYELKRLNQLTGAQLRKTLRPKRNNRVLVLITECLYNIVKGVVPVRAKKIKRYKKKFKNYPTEVHYSRKEEGRNSF